MSLISFSSFLLFYSVFVARGLLPADSGEFQVVVPLLGVAHPPGFPLYTLLGKLFIEETPARQDTVHRHLQHERAADPGAARPAQQPTILLRQGLPVQNHAAA